MINEGGKLELPGVQWNFYGKSLGNSTNSNLLSSNTRTIGHNYLILVKPSLTPHRFKQFFSTFTKGQ